MSLIIALILIIIVCILTAKDKSKSEAYERRRTIEKEAVGKWESLYVDKDLEARLERCIADERNYAAVREEISKVLSNTKHWSYLIDGDFPLNESQILGLSNQKQAYKTLRSNQRIALDIMLANRGKVSTMASVFGYNAYVRSGSCDLKESAYEYAETILRLMRYRSTDVELYCHCYLAEESYYWKGTHPEHRNDPTNGEILLPFDREEIFAHNAIPAIQ